MTLRKLVYSIFLHFLSLPLSQEDAVRDQLRQERDRDINITIARLEEEMTRATKENEAQVGKSKAGLKSVDFCSLT